MNDMPRHPLQYQPTRKSYEMQLAENLTRALKGDALAVSVSREDAQVIIKALEQVK